MEAAGLKYDVVWEVGDDKDEKVAGGNAEFSKILLLYVNVGQMRNQSAPVPCEKLRSRFDSTGVGYFSDDISTFSEN